MKKLAIAVGSGAIALGSLAFVLGLGGWAFEQRQLNQHNLRLQRLLEKEPGAAAVEAGILAEPDTRLLFSHPDPQELADLLDATTPERRASIAAQARDWPRTEVFSVGPMVYFLYFDEAEVMRGFACVRRRGE